MKRRHAILGGTLFALVVAVLIGRDRLGVLRWEGATSKASGSADAEQLSSQNDLEGAHLDEAQPALILEGASPVEVPSTRSALMNSNRSLRVVGQDGEPLEGVLGRWSPLDNDVMGFFLAQRDTNWLWHMQDRRDRMLAASELATTGADGWMHFARSPSTTGEVPSVIWLLHISYLARPVHLDAAATDWPSEPLTLDAHDASQTLVVDLEGRPIPGARVVQQAMLPNGTFPATEDLDMRTRRALFGTSITKVDGTAPLLAIAGAQYVQAFTDNAESLVYLLDSARDLTIAIGTCQLVEGKVIPMEQSAIGPWAVVTASGIVGQTGERIMLGETTIASGSYGPVRLAHDVRFVGYEVELIQGQNERLRRFLEVGEPGSVSRVDFRFREGALVWFQALDKRSGEGIPDASFQTTWNDPDGYWTGSGSISRADGWAAIEGLPLRGAFDLNVDAAGYHPYELAGMTLGTEDPTQPFAIPLDPMESLTLEVLSRGRPVSEYRYVIARPGAFEPLVERTIESALEGRTELNELIDGDLLLTVSTKGLGVRSAMPFSIPLEEGDVFRVELIPGYTARGKVIDARTGEPVSSATVVQRLTAGGSALGVDALETFLTGADGRFELSGFESSSGVVRVVAEGYAEQTMSNSGLEAGVLEFGSLQLRPLKTAVLFLMENGETVAAPGYAVRRAQGKRIDFDSSGELTIDLEDRLDSIDLIHPDGTKDVWQFGSAQQFDQRIPIDIRAGRTALIEFVDQDYQPIARAGRVWIECALPDGRVCSRGIEIAARSERFRTAALPGNLARITWEDWSTRAGMSAVYELAAEGTQQIRIVAERPNLVLSVTDSANRPIGGATVYLTTLNQNPHERIMLGRSTASDGLVQIQPPPSDMPYSIQVVGSDRAALESISKAEIESGPTPFPIVLQADLAVRLQFLHDGVPIEGLHIDLRDRFGTYVISNQRSGPEGHTDVGRLGPGSYLLNASTSELWPVVRLVESTLTSERTTIDLFAYGPVELKFLNSDGHPISDAKLELEHLRLAQTPKLWSERGWMDSYPIKTDALGEAAFANLPFGEYEASLETSQGLRTARFTVHEGRARQTVQLP